MKQSYCIALAGILAFSSPSFLRAEKKPLNVLFLCMDDLKPELGCYGMKEMKTPNIDHLAERGVLFEHHYVQEAVCAPSRMSTFSGMRPDRTRVWDLKTNLLDVRPDAQTMQEFFKKHGYTTAGCGKVMHGAKNEHPPSWTIPFCHDDQLPYSADYAPPADDQYQAPAIHKAFEKLETLDIKGYAPRKKWLAKQGARPATECLDVPDDAYADGAMAKWATQQLQSFKKSGKPFFLTVGFHKPHLPFVAPKKYWDLYDPKKIDLASFQKHAKNSPAYAYHNWGELRAYSDMPKKGDLTPEQQLHLIHAYQACVSYVDAQVGQVLQALQETGLASNTVVVLWGDHGWHLGDHGLWCKHSNFEQATHSPLIISAPGYASGRASGMVESIDMFPTLCELAGLPSPSFLEGKSLKPILKDPSKTVKPFSLSQFPRWDKYMGYALRTPRYRLVVWMKKEIVNRDHFDPDLIESIELYDYQTDPLETINQAQNPEYKTIKEDLLNLFKTVHFGKKSPNKNH
jgi:arylsulfatase A-like enzyme